MTSGPYGWRPSREKRSVYKSDSHLDGIQEPKRSSYNENRPSYNRPRELASHSHSKPKYQSNRSEKRRNSSYPPVEKKDSRLSLPYSRTKSSCDHSQIISTSNQCFPSGSYEIYDKNSRMSPKRTENFRESSESSSTLINKRTASICINYLPESHSDYSLENGLFHMFKEYGDVSNIQIYGTGSDRYAVIEFKKFEDSCKALAETQTRRLFGASIQVSPAPHKNLEVDEVDFRTTYDAGLDEYHAKATRILFIGGLDKEITISELRTLFEPFGEIIEIAIKNQKNSTSAFCQYSDIQSVVFAIKKLNGQFLGCKRLKLDFGLSVPNCCIWVGGISNTLTDVALCEYFNRFGIITNRNINRENGCALIAFENEIQASLAVMKARGCILNDKMLRIDFASNELQESFLDNLNNSKSLSHSDNSRSMSGRHNLEMREFEEFSENSFSSNRHKNDRDRRLENRLAPPSSFLSTDIASTRYHDKFNLGYHSQSETLSSHSNLSFGLESKRITPASRASKTNSVQKEMTIHPSRHDQLSTPYESNILDPSYQRMQEPFTQDGSGSSNLSRMDSHEGGKKSQMTRDKRTLFRKRLKLMKSLPKCTTVLQKLKAEKSIEEINKKLKQLLDFANQAKVSGFKNKYFDGK